MKLILKYLRKHIGIFIISTMFLTLEAIADLLQPTLMSYIIDKGVESLDMSLILYYGIFMIFIALAGAFSAIMRNYFASCTSQRIGKELRKDMYQCVQELSLENIDRLKPATIITRITNDVTQVQEFINRSMRMMVKAPITCMGAIALIIIQTPKQAPVMFGILCVVAFLIWGNMKIGYPRFGKVQDSLERLNAVTREFLISIRVVKAFHAEQQEMEKFVISSKKLSSANTQAMQTLAVFSPLINLTVNLGIVLLLWISKNQDSQQIGKLMASVNYMTQVLFAVNMLSGIMNTAVRATASASRIQEVLNEIPAQEKVTSSVELKTPKGNIEFQNVSFAYHNAGRAAISDMTFRIHQGETVGIIGPTGSGKTTLVNLIPRLYDATEGNVLIDGFDVKHIEEKELRAIVGVVPQKALLFTGSIEDNIRWGKADATDEEVRFAAQIACADTFIQNTEHGYRTQLGQGGVNLSGGQKQRLSLARALVRKPNILILDDCTSALDAQTEASVLKGLQENVKEMSVLLISQRISTVMRADKILCLDNGIIQGYGNHTELMEQCPVYRAIYHSQIGGAGDVE